MNELIVDGLEVQTYIKLLFSRPQKHVNILYGSHILVRVYMPNIWYLEI